MHVLVSLYLGFLSSLFLVPILFQDFPVPSLHLWLRLRLPLFLHLQNLPLCVFLILSVPLISSPLPSPEFCLVWIRQPRLHLNTGRTSEACVFVRQHGACRSSKRRACVPRLD